MREKTWDTNYRKPEISPKLNPLVSILSGASVRRLRELNKLGGADPGPYLVSRGSGLRQTGAARAGDGEDAAGLLLAREHVVAQVHAAPVT